MTKGQSETRKKNPMFNEKGADGGVSAADGGWMWKSANWRRAAGRRVTDVRAPHV